MWSAAADPRVLAALAEPPRDRRDRLFSAAMGNVRTLLALDSEHFLIARGEDLIRLDVVHGTTTGRPVAGGALLLQEFARRHQQSLGECPDLKQRIASRRYLIASEADDAIAARQALLDDATAQGMETSEQGFTRSRFRTIRNARDMAILAREVRLSRLDGLSDALAEARYDEYKFMVMTLE